MVFGVGFQKIQGLKNAGQGPSDSAEDTLPWNRVQSTEIQDGHRGLTALAWGVCHRGVGGKCPMTRVVAVLSPWQRDTRVIKGEDGSELLKLLKLKNYTGRCIDGGENKLYKAHVHSV